MPQPALWDSLIQIIQIEKEIINLMVQPAEEHNDTHNLVEYYRKLSNEYLDFLSGHVDYRVDCSAFNSLLEQYHMIKCHESGDEKLKHLQELFCNTKKQSSMEFMKHVLDDSIKESGKEEEELLVGWEKKCQAFESKMKNRILTLVNQQYSMVYGIASHECPLANQQSVKNDLDESSMLMACIYACMILHEENLPIQSESILKIVKASNIEITPIYASLVAKYLKNHPLESIIGTLGQEKRQEILTHPIPIMHNSQKYGIELSEYGIDEDVFAGVFED